MLLAKLEGIIFYPSLSNHFLEYEFSDQLALLMNSIRVDKLFLKWPSQLMDRKKGRNASLCMDRLEVSKMRSGLDSARMMADLAMSSARSFPASPE